MRELTFTIRDPRGMHDIPLGALVRKLCSFKSAVQFSCSTGSCNGKSLPAMLRLTLRRNDSFALRFSGQDEQEALQQIQILLQQYF
ncbi:MAG: HPr family phosphocarrier protein [Candidatus Anaerobiospirillum merdipullorum]|uniref:HPr family phosphocarrier protein n=1 Tax=Candidatus Anaerobiospirillum merdipullorum TaxID=2838450 RepID=A0A9E2NSS2_9GAMM|nr:HPr family phosphocarrier protein [Candidatus Anaerobiospirillum merdipullorum]